MELARAERAAIEGGQRIARASSDLADVEKPRDSAERWERVVTRRFQALREFSTENHCLPEPSQVPPHPERFIPSEEEIASYLDGLGFYQRGSTLWIREEDSITLGDCHDRNFIRTPSESIVAIDVQPLLPEGGQFESVIPWQATS